MLEKSIVFNRIVAVFVQPTEVRYAINIHSRMFSAAPMAVSIAQRMESLLLCFQRCKARTKAAMQLIGWIKAGSRPIPRKTGDSDRKPRPSMISKPKKAVTGFSVWK